MCVCVTWFAIKDYFCQNIFDVIYDLCKRITVKTPKNSFVYVYAVATNSCV